MMKILLINYQNYGEIYINDAFSCSHRKQTSINKITKHIKKSYAGPLFMKKKLMQLIWF